MVESLWLSPAVDAPQLTDFSLDFPLRASRDRYVAVVRDTCRREKATKE